MKRPAVDGVAPDLPTRLGLADDLGRVRASIGRWVERVDAEIREPVEWQLLGPSKYFRPMTVLACHRAMTGRPAPQPLVVVATAVELFHNVSLIVDDILDRSRLRRGRLTLHCRHGELRALMTAGYMTAAAFDLVAGDRYAVGVLAELMQRLGVAECLQWRLRRRPLGLADWRGIAAEDTGSMYEVCARLGTRDDRLRGFGRLLGMLYHGCDDVADVRGTKALGGGGREDVRDGILTLPAAIAIGDPRVAAAFARQGNGAGRLLQRKLVEALPKAEAYLDRLAADAAAEAAESAAHPEILLALVHHTRALAG